MNKLLPIVLLLIVVGGGYMWLTKNKNTLSTTPSPTALTQSPSPSPQKFADSSIASSAFKIFPGPLTAEAKTAMNGFSMQTTPQADGSTQVVLTATNPEYKDQQYVVKAGYSLYFIEKSSGDDQLNTNTDTFLKDDSAVLVDDQGFIVTQ